MDAVSQVLVDRSRELGGLERMVGASVLAHVGLVAVVMLGPSWWFGGKKAADEGPIMTISLGGPPGPRDGGMTTIGGRPIQTVPTEVKKVIEPVRPPAAKAPEMIEPTKNAPKKAEAKVDAKDPKSRTPTKGEKVEKGTAVAETGQRGQGFGLSKPSGFGDGATLDVANFCCPEYVAIMRDLIRQNWESRQQGTGTTVMKFTIQRNGQLTDISVARSSGYAALDFMAQRALLITRQLPPLPQAFTEPTLTVHLPFNYQQ